MNWYGIRETGVPEVQGTYGVLPNICTFWIILVVYRNFCVFSLCVCEVALERALAENQAKSYFVQHPQKLCPEISWQTGVSRVSGSLYSVLCPQGLCHWLLYLGTDWMETIFASVWTGPRSPAVFLAIPFRILMISHHLSHAPWGINVCQSVRCFCTRLRKPYRTVFGHV